MSRLEPIVCLGLLFATGSALAADDEDANTEMIAISGVVVHDVAASLLSVLPEDYDGKTVRTTLSLLTPLQGSNRALGCDKDDVPYMLGPQLISGQAPQMLLGTWVLCVSKALVPQVATQPMGAPVQFVGLLTVKGPKSAPRLSFSDVRLDSIQPLLVGVP